MLAGQPLMRLLCDFMAGVEFGYDVTDGVIIGGDYAVGKIYYGGRQQGPEIHTDTEHGCFKQCRKIVEQRKAEPWVNTGEDWEIRVWP